MAASDIVSKAQYQKAMSSLRNRINNVDTKFGGVMAEEHAHWNPQLWSRKKKLMNEMSDLRTNYGHLLHEEGI